MNEEGVLTVTETDETRVLLRRVAAIMAANEEDYARLVRLRELWRRSRSLQDAQLPHGLPRMAMALDMAWTFAREVDSDSEMLESILLSECCAAGVTTIEEIATTWSAATCELVVALRRMGDFVSTHKMGHQENFRGLLVSMSGDIRVVIVMIVRSLVMMRRINLHPEQEWVKEVAQEARILYSQLAHRLGLYGIKSVLEDLWLKYTDRTVYKAIASRLNEKKRERDAYIERFIGPVEQRLKDAGLTFTIKGRTKSIYSIWNKIMNKRVDMDHIYDLFAIRVVIDTPPKKEKADCWLAYSILANMYRPDPDRMRDWLSFPKSNGYESLHITVLGPEDKWVEVQFRTRRMDLVAEKGLAAHWRYKGGKSASTDQWMNAVRDVLESHGEAPMDAMKQMKLKEAEVYAFTPKGDLLKLPAGSTPLDFAFAIHTGVGTRCTGGTVNGRYEKISYKLRSGDTVKVLTSSSQAPRHDWLALVRTSKARNKIRQSLDEGKRVKADLGREMLLRRMRNRKLETEESDLSRLIVRQGYKFAIDFFADVADGKVDVGRFLDMVRERNEEAERDAASTTAGGFQLQRPSDEGPGEPLVIGRERIKGLNYKFARCCNPLPGDPVFGFIAGDGAVKIHRTDCPNAYNIRGRYPYRVIGARWAGDDDQHAASATLRIVGKDSIGIVTNITSIIDREPGLSLHSVQITSNDGLFCGFMDVKGPGREALTGLVRKLVTIKGVKDVRIL